jgi:hypothetical protein
LHCGGGKTPTRAAIVPQDAKVLAFGQDLYGYHMHCKIEQKAVEKYFTIRPFSIYKNK